MYVLSLCKGNGKETRHLGMYHYPKRHSQKAGIRGDKLNIDFCQNQVSNTGFLQALPTVCTRKTCERRRQTAVCWLVKSVRLSFSCARERGGERKKERKKLDRHNGHYMSHTHSRGRRKKSFSPCGTVVLTPVKQVFFSPAVLLVCLHRRFV